MATNTFSPKVCEIKMSMHEWQVCGIPIIEGMSAVLIEKFDKYWSDIPTLMAISVILNPSRKLIYLHACYIALFGEENIEYHINKSHELLCDLLNEYGPTSGEEVTDT